MNHERILSYLPAIKKKEKKEIPQDTFNIRGHHLWHIRDLLLSGDSAEEFARKQRKANFPIRIGDIFMDEEYVQKQEIRIKDTYGSNNTEADVVERDMMEFYKDFLNLPDKATVAIVEGKKDGICHAAKTGDHCFMVNNFRGDSIYSDIFMKAAPKRKLTVTQEIATFSDAEQKIVRRIETTAGTLRRVLKSESYKKLLQEQDL